MPNRPTAERGHLPASIFERNRVWRWRNHPKTSENLIFCELRNFNSETSSLVTLPSRGESAANSLSPVTMGRPHRGPDYGSDHRNTALGQPCHHPSRRSSALSEPLAWIAGGSPQSHGARLADNGGEE